MSAITKQSPIVRIRSRRADGQIWVEPINNAALSIADRKPFNVVSSKMILAEQGSFWALSGLSEKSALPGLSKLAGSPIPSFVGPKKSDSVYFSFENDSEPSLLPPAWKTELGIADDWRRADDAHRLWVVWRPASQSRRELLESLRRGHVRCGPDIVPDAILIGGDTYFLRENYTVRDGHIVLSKSVNEANVELVEMELGVALARIEKERALVFAERPNILGRAVEDIRDDATVIASTAALFERIKSALEGAQAPSASLEEMRGVVLKYIESVAGSHDERDLQRLLDALAKRDRLIDLFPEVVRKVPRYSREIDDLVETEKNKRVAEVQATIDELAAERMAEVVAVEDDLAAKRKLIEEASVRLEDRVLAVRELEASLDEKIESALNRLYDISSSEFRSMIGRVRTNTELVETLARSIDTSVADRSEVATFDPTDLLRNTEFIRSLALQISGEIRSDARLDCPVDETAVARTASIDMVSAKIGIGPSALASMFGFAVCGRLPLFVGPEAMEVAEAFSNLVGGPNYFVQFCNPTLVSFEDLFSGSTVRKTPFASAVEVAIANPDRIIPAVLANLDLAPFGFWIDGIQDRRSYRALPPNLVVSATVTGEDGQASLSALRGTVKHEAAGIARPLSTKDRRDLKGWTYPRGESAAKIAEILAGIDMESLTPGLRQTIGQVAKAASWAGDVDADDIALSIQASIPWLLQVAGQTPPQDKWLIKLTDGRR
ncbi:hypothetical protein [Rhizobium sp. EC-SD404]|uniref:hypothetical protein n=1 Tax=Rhizobium sp. EC-SD404 TaxID=2038389 RepID=UPI0012517A3A|nr:hypothetical protein [Rhizobium sp. EC-SD404]VVT31136.1 hypothetical protein RHIZ404_230243 [Rhizobium sp. EC-SD404]